MVGDKKRRKGGGRERLEKDTSAFFCRSAGRIHPKININKYLIILKYLSKKITYSFAPPL
ncbi:hypothetical protein [Aneurinibacillus migulanus]|uniref:hypothetical protein n=1 Tax=Aneurinibacillus migulanus TaxID=47500 RepID=UPI001F18F3AA|nr:hypothetical protein [Aneurinibacillus migulanus]